MLYLPGRSLFSVPYVYIIICLFLIRNTYILLLVLLFVKVRIGVYPLLFGKKRINSFYTSSSWIHTIIPFHFVLIFSFLLAFKFVPFAIIKWSESNHKTQQEKRKFEEKKEATNKFFETLRSIESERRRTHK